MGNTKIELIHNNCMFPLIQMVGKVISKGGVEALGDQVGALIQVF